MLNEPFRNKYAVKQTVDITNPADPRAIVLETVWRELIVLIFIVEFAEFSAADHGVEARICL